MPESPDVSSGSSPTPNEKRLDLQDYSDTFLYTKAITAANIIVIYSLDQGLISIPATGLCNRLQYELNYGTPTPPKVYCV